MFAVNVPLVGFKSTRPLNSPYMYEAGLVNDPSLQAPPARGWSESVEIRA